MIFIKGKYHFLSAEKFKSFRVSKSYLSLSNKNFIELALRLLEINLTPVFSAAVFSVCYNMFNESFRSVVRAGYWVDRCVKDM